MLQNPDANIIKSQGIDRPFLYVYLAGRIAGDCIDKCLSWRHQIVDYYRNYKGKGAYPIVFLDALNSKEADSIDTKGLTSAIPPNMIYDKDLLSVETADVVVANMADYMDAGIEELLKIPNPDEYKEGSDYPYKDFDFCKAFFQLQERIVNRRPNWGTDSEVSWALYLKKPLILIASSDIQKSMLEKHPFMKRASVIVGSAEELLDKKWLNILYKSISGAIY
jgi:hypothetical protein